MSCNTPTPGQAPSTRFPGRTPALSRGNIRGLYPSEAGKDPGSRTDFKFSRTCNATGRTWPGTRVNKWDSQNHSSSRGAGVVE